MTTPRPSPESIAAEIRHVLRDGGSAEHAAGVQWFFKDEIKSHGWYTAKLRSVAVRFRRRIQEELGVDFLLQVADKLFVGRILEEKVFAVFLLEKLTELGVEAVAVFFMHSYAYPENEERAAEVPTAELTVTLGGRIGKLSSVGTEQLNGQPS